MQRLRDIQMKAGAVFGADSPAPITFTNDPLAVQAARRSVAVCDRSHWGRLQFTDRDRLEFLHNQSTNDFKILQPGQGCETVFVTPTARTIDLATAYVLEDAVLLLVSPHRREKLLSWLDRYIFFGDQVKLTDVTEQTALFSLIGPESPALLEHLGAGELAAQPDASHAVFPLADHPVRIAVGSGLGMTGYTLMLDLDAAADVWQVLLEAAAVPLGDRIWEQLRIEQGRPLPDTELTDDYNPLEAGLWHTISLNKGCYIGQETIARLHTYKGVKQQLWGVRLSAWATPGTAITLDGEKIGILTSLTQNEQGFWGLAYIRTKAGGVGLNVNIGDRPAEVVKVPFLTHDYPA